MRIILVFQLFLTIIFLYNCESKDNIVNHSCKCDLPILLDDKVNVTSGWDVKDFAIEEAQKSYSYYWRQELYF